MTYVKAKNCLNIENLCRLDFWIVKRIVYLKWQSLKKTEILNENDKGTRMSHKLCSLKKN